MHTVKGVLHQLPDLERGMARIQSHRCKPAEFVKILQAFEKMAGASPASAAVAEMPVLLRQVRIPRN